MITLRLDSQLEQNLINMAAQMGVSKSELVRICIKNFMTQQAEQPTAWELGQHLFGKYASPDPDLARNRKALIKDKIKAKK